MPTDKHIEWQTELQTNKERQTNRKKMKQTYDKQTDKRSPLEIQCHVKEQV